MFFIGVEAFEQGWEDLTAGKDIETVLSDVAGGVIAIVSAVKQI